MKNLKIVLIVVILVAIIGIFPILLYIQTSNATSVVNNTNCRKLTGVGEYFSNIASDPNATQEIKDNAANMVDASQKMLKYKDMTFGVLVIYLSLVIDVLLFVFGMFLKKSVSDSKIGVCMICSSLLGFTSTVYILISTILSSVNV